MYKSQQLWECDTMSFNESIYAVIFSHHCKAPWAYFVKERRYKILFYLFIYLVFRRPLSNQSLTSGRRRWIVTFITSDSWPISNVNPTNAYQNLTSNCRWFQTSTFQPKSYVGTRSIFVAFITSDSWPITNVNPTNPDQYPKSSWRWFSDVRFPTKVLRRNNVNIFSPL